MLSWIRKFYPRPSIHGRIPTFPRTAWYDADFYKNMVLPGAVPFPFFTLDYSIANTFKDQPPQRYYLTANAHNLATSSDGTGYFRFRDIRSIATTGPSDFQYDKAHFSPLFMQLPSLRSAQLDEALTDLCEQLLFLHRRFDLLLTNDPLTTDPNPLIVDLSALVTKPTCITVSSFHAFKSPHPRSAQQPTFNIPSINVPINVTTNSIPACPDINIPFIIPSAKPGNLTVKKLDRVDPLMPAPKRQRGLGMRYSTPLPSYLPLGGRDDSTTRPIKQRCTTNTDSGSIFPPQPFDNPAL